MRQYDVYGLGNALVDIQFRVDPSFFETMEIDKGVMTLIDGDRQRALIRCFGWERDGALVGWFGSQYDDRVGQLWWKGILWM